jgi:hypothetical protein
VTNNEQRITRLETDGGGAQVELQDMSDALMDMMPGAFPAASQSSRSGSIDSDISQEELRGTPSTGQMTADDWSRVQSARFDLPRPGRPGATRS